MRVEKLKEALAELAAERKAVDAAISAIEAVIANSNGRIEVAPRKIALVQDDSGGYVNMAVAVLAEFGSPIHIKELVKEISLRRGQSVDRKSVEATFSKHMHSTATPKLIKAGPGLYALPGASTSANQPRASQPRH